mgnify:CR=1 FL=1
MTGQLVLALRRLGVDAIGCDSSEAFIAVAPEEVRPQHVAPADSVVLHQTLHSCGGPAADEATVTVTVDWRDAVTFEPRQVVRTATIATLLSVLMHKRAMKQGDSGETIELSELAAEVSDAPAKGKRSHWVNAGTNVPADANQWFDTAKELPGSWWPDWALWLKGHAGKTVPAPTMHGNRKHKPIEPAPGRYVKQKA